MTGLQEPSYLMFPLMYLKGILILFFVCYVRNLIKLLLSWNMKFMIMWICTPRPWAYLWLKNKLSFILFEVKAVLTLSWEPRQISSHIHIEEIAQAICDFEVICRKPNVQINRTNCSIYFQATMNVVPVVFCLPILLILPLLLPMAAG